MSTTASPVARRKGVVAATALMAVVAVVIAAVWWSRGGDPPVIRIVEGSGTQSAALGAAERAGDDAMDADMAESSMFAPIVFDFVLADSARIDAGEAVAWRLVPPADLRDAATELAAHFELGEVSPSPYDDGFFAGDAEGVDASLWVGTSGDWWFNDPTGQPIYECSEPAFEGSADDASTGSEDRDSPGGDPVVTIEGGEQELPAIEDQVRCAEPTPPDGVPSSAGARSLATALFADLDVPGDLGDLEVFADERGAWVHGQLQIEGSDAGVGFSAGYGAESRLTSAGGTLAKLERVGEYPTVDAETAVERLRNNAWGGNVLLERGEATSLDAAVSTDVAVDAATVEEPAVLVDPLPVGEMEARTVTLVAVEPVLVVVYDIDSAMWLVPGYRFTADDGGIWEVMAIADGFVEFDTGGNDGSDVAEPPPAEEPEPLPVDPPTAPSEPIEPEPGDGGATGGAGSAPEPPTDQPIEIDPNPGEDPPPPLGLDPELEVIAAEVVGSTEDEALALIEEAGAVVRVVARDGESFMVTDDYRLDRVNLKIENGVVLDAYIG